MKPTTRRSNPDITSALKPSNQSLIRNNEPNPEFRYASAPASQAHQPRGQSPGYTTAQPFAPRHAADPPRTTLPSRHDHASLLNGHEPKCTPSTTDRRRGLVTGERKGEIVRAFPLPPPSHPESNNMI
ncbi:unnamed protein product [Aspergillus oryzae]|uniref:Unnamed protein product n=1 Tax=Aspergillus oryzae var. brunneus TaxID=332754 RepID=A0ABQ6KMT7_ASPOZ|nr:unnamed protein product [Aspergillus oryzae]GMF84804.1 unnamed protein product [Aspergillus oryzae]GMG03467.1 unnamed protein product [Aspergillus oryzae]GMG43668.1 unnamed protein product [Aspergillus oryzae var. brunneus]